MTEKTEGINTAAEEKNTSSCSELPSAVSELPVVEIPLNDGSTFPLYRKDLDEYADLYPAVDVDQEARKMRAWCISNPIRRKTRRGVRRFINGWLSRAQDRGRPVPRPDVPENPFLKYATGDAEMSGGIL